MPDAQFQRSTEYLSNDEKKEKAKERPIRDGDNLAMLGDLMIQKGEWIGPEADDNVATS